MEFSVDNEDIHMNIETLLTQRIGDAGKRSHTARSPERPGGGGHPPVCEGGNPCHYLHDPGSGAGAGRESQEHTDTVMPGHTHLQRAQPTTFGHYMMAYANMFKR